MPVNLSAAYGQGGTAIVRLQNRGPATVYRSAGAGVPDPAAVRGFRHPVGSDTRVWMSGQDHPTWVWTRGQPATLVLEPGYDL